MSLQLVSCVVPAHNAERFLGEAIASILEQTHRPLEVLVVDDGSTDATSEVVRRVAETSPDASIRYLHQERSGPAAARNRGMRRARGEFVAFLDADDLWVPEKLEVQLERFRVRPELDAVFAYLQNFWMPEVRPEELRAGNHPRSRPHPSYSAGTLLARGELFAEVGPFDTKAVHSDVPCWYEEAVRRGAEVEILEEVLLRRRLHRDNYSRRASAAAKRHLLEMLKRRVDRRRSEANPEDRPTEGPASTRRHRRTDPGRQ